MSAGEDRSNRRTATRIPMKEPISLTFTGEALQGETIDLSTRGALLRAKGTVRVTFSFKGEEYQARLVRVVPSDSGVADYAIELRDPVGAISFGPDN